MRGACVAPHEGGGTIFHAKHDRSFADDCAFHAGWLSVRHFPEYFHRGNHGLNRYWLRFPIYRRPIHHRDILCLCKKARGAPHRGDQYAKLGRFLAIELALPREERIAAGDLLKMTKENIERLLEIAPPVPDTIVSDFNRKFSKSDVAKPDICNGIHKVSINIKSVHNGSVLSPLPSPSSLQTAESALPNPLQAPLPESRSA